MKKLFQFAFVAAIVAVVAACGNKAGGAGDKDSVATEQVKEEVSLDVDKTHFTLTAPEGWNVSDSGSSGVRIDNGDESFDGKKSITVSDVTARDMPWLLENYTRGDGVQKDDLTAAGITWKVVVNDQSKNTDLFAEVPGGGAIVHVSAFHVTVGDEVFTKLLETIKLK